MSDKKRLDYLRELQARSSALDATAVVATSPQGKEARVADDDEWMIALSDSTRVDVRDLLASHAIVERSVTEVAERPMLAELVRFIEGESEELSRSASEYFGSRGSAFPVKVAVAKLATVRDSEGAISRLRPVTEIIQDDEANREVLKKGIANRKSGLFEFIRDIKQGPSRN